jgi:hypothetical protein
MAGAVAPSPTDGASEEELVALRVEAMLRLYSRGPNHVPAQLLRSKQH